MCQRSIYLFPIIGCLISFVLSQSFNSDNIRQVFVNQLIQHLGNGSVISNEDIQLYYENSLWKWSSDKSLSECTANISAGNTDESCLLEKCLSPSDVYELSGLSTSTTEKQVSTMSAILLYLSEGKRCQEDTAHESKSYLEVPPSTIEVWGYSILCTTIIAISALGGLLALPCVEGVNYKRTLIYMVGLAVGTLAGSSLLFLVPEALELTEQDLDQYSYVWKCLVMVSAVYLFFNVERILKMYSLRRERIKREQNVFRSIHGGRFASLTPEGDHYLQNLKRFKELRGKHRLTERMHSVSGVPDIDRMAIEPPTLSTMKEEANGMETEAEDNVNAENVNEADEPHIAPVAWMIVFGDALHNLIDGVSIGAAFTESVIAGVSVSVAILCEELPHELGDFAVLVSSGMSMKRAALYNFMSACTIYVGTIIGVFLGENLETHTWVFAFAAGMFLYIALVDMMPEMMAASELEENKELLGTGSIFLLQNLGILTGFGVILILAVFGGNIEETIRGDH